MIDRIAVAQFITDTAFTFAPEIAGAVIAISATILVFYLFRNKILRRVLS